MSCDRVAIELLLAFRCSGDLIAEYQVDACRSFPRRRRCSERQCRNRTTEWTSRELSPHPPITSHARPKPPSIQLYNLEDTGRSSCEDAAPSSPSSSPPPPALPLSYTLPPIPSGTSTPNAPTTNPTTHSPKHPQYTPRYPASPTAPRPSPYLSSTPSASAVSPASPTTDPPTCSATLNTPAAAPWSLRVAAETTTTFAEM